MHIAFLTPEYPNEHQPEGGLGNYINKVAREFVKRGYRVTVFVLGNKSSEIQDEGISLKLIKKIKVPWRLKKIKKLTKWLEIYERWLNVRQLHDHVLAYHQEYPLAILQTPNYQYLGIALCHNGLFPVICRCSSYSPLWRAANGHRRTLDETISDWFETRQVIDADAVFAPSQLIAQIYTRFESIQTKVIRTPVELPNVADDKSVYQEFAGKKYLLYFGTLNGVKGVDVLFRAVPDILDKNEDVSIIFIGRNDRLPTGEPAMDWVDKNLSSYKQEGRIIYFPPLPNTQLYPIIKHAFGVVMPSRVDNYPNACLEALALGVPVIGTRHSSLDEIIVDGVTGFLAENGGPSSLFIGVNRLLTQTSQNRATMIQAIRKAVNEMLQEDRVGILLKYYQEVISAFSSHA